MVDQIRAEITALWVTEHSRTNQPTVTDEVRTSLFYFDNTLWDALPQIYHEMAQALAEFYPGLQAPGRFLTFGSWVGGDRDGNPNVTPAVTAETLRLHRGLAVERHRRAARRLDRLLSLSDRLAPASETLLAALDEAREQALGARCLSRTALSQRTVPPLRRRAGRRPGCGFRR